MNKVFPPIKLDRGRASELLTRFPRAFPLGVLLLVVAITLLSVWKIEADEAAQRKAKLEAHTSALASALEQRAYDSSTYLRAGAALIGSREDISAEDFARFVAGLQLKEGDLGADGIGWAQIVYPYQIDEYEALMAQSVPGSVSGDNIRLRPALDGSQAFAVPVTYLVPDSARNRLALGYDMYSQATRRNAMIAAAESKRPTASDQVVLEQEGEDSAPGFLIYMPVFETARSDGSQPLKGYIYSPYNAQQFLVSAHEQENAGNFGVQLFDGSEDERGSLLAQSGAGPSNSDVSTTRLVSIADNPYLLVVSQQIVPFLSAVSVATLIFGFLVAALLAIVAWLLGQQALKHEASLQWFEEQASIRNSLTRELNHRVKNTLANVLSMIALTRGKAENLDCFADGLDGRVRSLSGTHDLLTQSEWGTTPICSVVEAELLPFLTCGDHKLEINGPDVELAPKDALSLGLALHELATNAAKYGALSITGGSVGVKWSYVDDATVELQWTERGGPPVPQERGRGFGTDLLERVVAKELASTVKLSFDCRGVCCVLTVPVRSVQAFSLRANCKRQIVSKSGRTPAPSPAGKRQNKSRKTG